MARFCEECPNRAAVSGEIEQVKKIPICGDKLKGLGFAALASDIAGNDSGAFYWGGFGLDSTPDDLADAISDCQGPKVQGWRRKTVICGAPGIKPLEQSYASEFGNLDAVRLLLTHAPYQPLKAPVETAPASKLTY